MLAVLLALLSAVAGLPADGMAETETAATETADPVAEAAWLVGLEEDCCGEIVADAPAHPCAPGESCPPTGGCCACVSCGKRMASVPPPVRPVEGDGTESHGVSSEGPTGTEEVGAVWHPPRG